MDKIKRTIGFLLSHPLGKKHPFQTIFRFTLWQLQCLLSPSKLRVKEFVGGIKFYANKGLTGITGNIYSGLHEFDDMGFLLHFLRTDDVFFDIGANVGSYTLLASGVCGANSVAIEPARKAFGIISKNIALNSIQQKVKLINDIAGGSMSRVVFTEDEDTKNHVIAAGELNTHAAESNVITIDSLLAKGSPVLIKIDVEGYETEVLKGMHKTLDDTTLKAIIIELNGAGSRYGFDEDKIHELLLSKDFRPYQYYPFTRELVLLKNHGAYNTIYCRDIPFIDDRVKNARPIKIMGEMI